MLIVALFERGGRTENCRDVESLAASFGIGIARRDIDMGEDARGHRGGITADPIDGLGRRYPAGRSMVGHEDAGAGNGGVVCAVIAQTSDVVEHLRLLAGGDDFRRKPWIHDDHPAVRAGVVRRVDCDGLRRTRSARSQHRDERDEPDERPHTASPTTSR